MRFSWRIPRIVLRVCQAYRLPCVSAASYSRIVLSLSHHNAWYAHVLRMTIRQTRRIVSFISRILTYLFPYTAYLAHFLSCLCYLIT